MPRSIRQLKHRVIQFDSTTPEQLASAVLILERLPGVTAFANVANQSIGIDYWVDEYTLSELELELANRGYLLEGGIRNRILRAEIQRDEDAERDKMDIHTPACRSCGVFAQTYHQSRDDYEALPLCM